MAEGFNFESLQQQLSEQRILQERRQALQVEGAKKTQEINNRSAKVMARTQKEIAPLQENMRRIVQQTQQSRQLADSGNFMDNLKLMGLQATNPNAYTREGRQNRLREDSALMSAMTQASNLEMQALQYESMASQGRVDEAKMIEAIGAERLRMVQDEAAIIRGNFEASETMKFGALHGMGLPELTAAAAAAGKNGGKVEINGVEIPELDIKERVGNLQEREFQLRNQAHLRKLMEYEFGTVDQQIELKKFNMQVQQDEMARYPLNKQIQDSQTQINAANSTPEATRAKIDSDAARRRLDLDEAQNVDTTLRTRNAERKIADSRSANVDTQIALERGASFQALQEQIRYGQRNILKTMKSDELLAIQRNGYVDEAGNDYAVEDVNTAINNQMQIQAGKLDQLMGQKNLENFSTTALAEEATRVDQLSKRFATNSPLWAAAQTYKNNLGASALAADSPDYFIKSKAQSHMMKAREDFMKAVEIQAKRDANGDVEVAALYADFYSGQPVQTETLKNVVSRKIMAGKDISNLVPTSVAISARRKYVDRMSADSSLRGGVMNALGAGGEDKKLKQQEAAASAFEEAIRESAAQRLDVLIGAQVKMPGHPLHGWSTEQMLTVTRQADTTALRRTEEDMNLRPGQLSEIKAGKSAAPEGFDMQQAQALLTQYENTELISALNGLGNKGGKELLGEQVARWWVDNSEQYVKMNHEAFVTSQQTSNDFASSALNSAQLGIEVDEMRAYASNLYGASELATDSIIQQQANYFAFGGKPEYNQALLLQLDTNLTDSDRALVYKELIQPTLQQAKQRGLDFKATNYLVERAIMNADVGSQNKELTTILKGIRRTRGDMTKTLETVKGIANAASWGGTDIGSLKRGPIGDANSGLGWFRELNSGQ